MLRSDRARPAGHGEAVILFLAAVSLLIAAYLVYSLLRPEDF
ncbi:K(+)-transporting ATPase subunit F [Deinococcus metalli]|nr:K(+)-transporting ATPase subunit F [Deinococcus metalli]